MSGSTSLISRLSRLGDDRGGELWYTRPWVTIAIMYAFLPAGLYHMWRYRGGWPRWLKWFSTIFGPAFAAFWGYVTSVYIWPRIF